MDDDSAVVRRVNARDLTRGRAVVDGDLRVVRHLPAELEVSGGEGRPVVPDEPWPQTNGGDHRLGAHVDGPAALVDRGDFLSQPGEYLTRAGIGSYEARVHKPALLGANRSEQPE